MTSTPAQQPQATTAPFGLLGRKLGHSWSPRIHTTLGSIPYELFEREPEEVEPFIRKGSWRGINVTIPYKRDAARLADERSPRVERLGAACFGIPGRFLPLCAGGQRAAYLFRGHRRGVPLRHPH